MTLEIMCTDLRDFRTKSVGAASKNCFAKIGLMVALEEGHVRNQVEVVVWHVRSVCAKFGMDRGSGSGDKRRAKSVM